MLRVRSENRQFDRKACTSPMCFHDYKKLELLQIKNSPPIYLRHFSGRDRILAQNILKGSFPQNWIQHDYAYNVLKGVRFSFTLRSWEKKWNCNASPIWASNLELFTFNNILINQDMYYLIWSDGVAFAIYFDYRYWQSLMLFKAFFWKFC